MGADMILTAVVIPGDVTIEAMKNSLLEKADALTMDCKRKDEIENFFNEELGEIPDDLTNESLRTTFKDFIIEGFAPIIGDSRELATIEHNDDTIYVTGGLSGGEDPTDIFEPIRKLAIIMWVLREEETQ
jgi:hypothetical protein